MTILPPRELRGQVVLRHDDFILRHHQVHDVPVLPGVAFLDLACRTLSGNGVDLAGVALTDVVFPEAVAGIAGLDTEIEVVVDAAAPRRRVTGRSRRLSGGARTGAWRLNFLATVAAKGRSAVPQRAPAAPSGPGTRVRTIEDMYAHTRSRQIRHGEPMRCTGSLRIGGGELVGELALASAGSAAERGFCLHPAKLDAATIAAYGQTDITAMEPFIPMFIECFYAPRPLPGHFTVYVPRTERLSPSRELFRSDLYIYDAHGRLAVEMTGLSCKRIREAGLIRRLVEDSGATDGRAAGA